ncbi:MAG: hypothetical protein ABI818_17970 [Acidobacteriota bacterium]
MSDRLRRRHPRTLAAVTLAACGSSTPTTPTAAVGDSSSFSNYDDCVSSIRVPAGLTAVVFRDANYSGASATYVADVTDLDVVTGPCKPGFNDCISSIRISGPSARPVRDPASGVRDPGSSFSRGAARVRTLPSA